MSYLSAIASLGAATTTPGESDDRNYADQHIDDLGGRRARTHRGIGVCPIGRNSATDRDQRGEPDERQRLRIELLRLGPGSSSAFFRKLCVIDGQTAQPFGCSPRLRLGRMLLTPFRSTASPGSETSG